MSDKKQLPPVNITDITDTLRALVLAMSNDHSGNQTEAFAIARAIVAAVADGKVPLIRLERP